MSRAISWSAWIGYDPREAAAFAVCKSSIERRTFTPLRVRGVVLDHLRARGMYWRPTERRDGRLWDVISGAPMSTEFAISRFLVPQLAGSGWALFMDCDVMALADVRPLFEKADPKKAVYVVKHKHEPPAGVKMDGQAQMRYARKNWSSVMLFNCDHPANKKLTVELINSVPGRDLHRFCWLKDRDIGSLHPEWNYLVGHTKLAKKRQPKLVHWTEGLPSVAGYENTEYASDFWSELQRWAA